MRTQTGSGVMLVSFKSISMAILTGFLLTACTQAPEQDNFTKLMDSTGKWVMSEEEKANYARYETNEARSRFVSDKFARESAVLQTDAERLDLAAAIYTNFALLQARAIPDYCKGMNVDISAYQTAFAQTNHREERTLTQVLTARGTSVDALYERYAKKLRTTAKYELMSAGSSYSACKTVADDPNKMARLTKFSNFFPKVANVLRQ